MTVRKYFSGGSLFAGANSGRGFVSFYKELFDSRDIERVYILKGGPGTGKSSFMRRAAEFARAKGRETEFYSCSSDPESLDAVIIDGRIAMLDGTAPHTAEPVIPGAREEIINLGEFWDGEKLCERFAEIKSLGKKKNRCYEKAYTYLAAYKNIVDVNTDLVLPFVKTEKMQRAVSRITAGITTGGGFEARPGLVDSICMRGRVRLDTYERFADKLYIIDDYFSSAHLWLRLLVNEARRTDTPIRVSYEPWDPERPDAVFFCADRVAFVVSDGCTSETSENRINMRRFIDTAAVGEIRSEYRANVRFASSLMDSVLEALAKAGECHFALEEIYKDCMDFEAQERFERSFLENRI